MSPWDGVTKLVRHGIVKASRVARAALPRAAALVVGGLARSGHESPGRRGGGLTGITEASREEKPDTFQPLK